MPPDKEVASAKGQRTFSWEVRVSGEKIDVFFIPRVDIKMRKMLFLHTMLTQNYGEKIWEKLGWFPTLLFTMTFLKTVTEIKVHEQYATSFSTAQMCGLIQKFEKIKNKIL